MLSVYLHWDSTKGSRVELESRILDFAAKLESGEFDTGAVSTPERRDGRKRSPYRGALSQVQPLPSIGIPDSQEIATAVKTIPGVVVSIPMQEDDPLKKFNMSTPQTRRVNNCTK